MSADLVILNQFAEAHVWPRLPRVPFAFETAEPESVTILPTYRCNAACTECCFESHPGIKHRMTRNELLSLIRRIRTELPRVKYVVLSGGEVTLLRKDLFDALSLLRELNLGSRIVTNGHWARTDDEAKKWVEGFTTAGLGELNLSTGDEHLEWVPVASVARAALHATQKGLLTLVTIEGSAGATFRLEQFQKLPAIRKILSDPSLSKYLIILTNVWMPFHSGTTICGSENKIPEGRGCDNVFDNFAVNPHGFLMSCCGLTMEYIPEIKIGHLADRESLQHKYRGQFDDLLKLWIWLDGTQVIFDLASVRSGEAIEQISPHQCALCAQIYQDPRLRIPLRELLQENSNNIVFRSMVKARLTGRVGPLGPLAAAWRRKVRGDS
jgi:Radical SAM superfamily